MCALLTLNFQMNFHDLQTLSINQKSVLLTQCFKNTLWLSDFSGSSFVTIASQAICLFIFPSTKSSFCTVTDVRLSYKMLVAWVRYTLCSSGRGRFSDGGHYRGEMKKMKEMTSGNTKVKTYVWNVLQTESRLSDMLLCDKTIWIL